MKKDNTPSSRYIHLSPVRTRELGAEDAKVRWHYLLDYPLGTLSRGRAISAKSIIEETLLLGIIHLTEARPSSAEFQNIARYLSEELG